MGFKINSSTQYQNTGQLCENTQIAYSGVWLVPQGFSFANQAAAETKATVIAATKAAIPNRLYPLGVFDNITPEDQENVMKDRPFLGGKFISWGKNGFTAMLDANFIKAKNLYNLINGKKWAVYLFDENDNIEGVSSDGIKFEPRRCLSVQVLPRKTAAAGENKVLDIKFVLADTEESMTNVAVIKPTTYKPSEIEGLHNVELETVGSWSATGGKVKVSYAETGNPVTGLLPADFVIPGKTVSTATFSESDNTYSIGGTSLVTSTIDLAAASAISLTTIGIESTGAVAITIS